jgi:hypothetical protein
MSSLGFTGSDVASLFLNQSAIEQGCSQRLFSLRNAFTAREKIRPDRESIA